MGSRICCLAWLAVIAAVSPAFAWQPAVARDKAPAQRYALLVGVRKYDPNELRPLNYAEQDITDMAAILRDSGYKRVVVLTQTAGAEESRFLPTAANIRTALHGILEDRNEQDTVLVAMSGHGVQYPSSDKAHPEIYFCPMDTKLANRKTLVSMSEVYKELDASKAGLKLLIVDACRNNPQSDNSRARAEVDLESVTRPQRIPPPGGTAVLFSCSEGQRAYDHDKLKHGVFFNYVLEGLRGKADFSGKGNVSIDSLALYVKSQVTDYVKEAYGDDVRQVPELIGKTNGLAPLVNIASRPWISIFDGKTLKGWKPFEPGENWSVKEGAIVGKGARSHLFYVDRELTDFEFKADARLNQGGNSGMYFRAEFGAGRLKMFPLGYEAQICNTDLKYPTGSLYYFAAAPARLAPDNTWFNQYVAVRGNRITIKINDKTAVDYVDEKETYKKGLVALQLHDAATVVEFKNLMIRPLPAR